MKYWLFFHFFENEKWLFLKNDGFRLMLLSEFHWKTRKTDLVFAVRKCVIECFLMNIKIVWNIIWWGYAMHDARKSLCTHLIKHCNYSHRIQHQMDGYIITNHKGIWRNFDVFIDVRIPCLNTVQLIKLLFVYECAKRININTITTEN